jgi:hypothetical protein
MGILARVFCLTRARMPMLRLATFILEFGQRISVDRRGDRLTLPISPIKIRDVGLPRKGSGRRDKGKNRVDDPGRTHR